MHVILDTNVIIAALKSTAGASHALLLQVHRREITPVVSVPLFMEYEEISKRPGMLPHLGPDQIDVILNQICARAIEQRIYFRWRPFLPDPDDDMLVELAIAGNVPYIITGNLAGVSPARELGIQVITPAEFLRIHRQP